MQRSILRYLILAALCLGASGLRAATIFQAANSQAVAWEAEDTFSITNATPTTWGATNDATASGNRALYAAGATATAAPSSLASYTIKFRAAGTYSLYFRWRADSKFTDLDGNSANSYYRPNDFGDLGPDVANYAASSANNSRTPPAVNSYGMTLEGLTYTVTQEQVDAGEPLIFKAGTREAGMFIDRFVFSQNAALTEAEFNALPNSGSVARPSLVSASGTANLTTVILTFDRPLSPASVVAGNFTIGGGINVTAATLNLNTSKDVILTTSAQSQGSSYTVTVNGVVDVSNNPVAPNTQKSFTAWKISNGWITRELYYNVTGTTIAELQASPTFPDSPSAVDFVRSVTIGNDLQQANYGARFRGYYTPTQTGAHEFYLYGDDDALLSLSTGESPANLAPVLPAVTGVTAFDPAVVYVSGSLNAGQRYLFEVLFQQSVVPASLGLAVRRVGTAGAVAALPLLGGSTVSTLVNPDADVLNFRQQPASATVPAGERAKLSVTVTALNGGKLFYQWQLNRVDIPGATRPSYVTPILTAADSGNKYRCVVGVSGTDVLSQEATITVGSAQPSPLQPYVGINFASGGDTGTTVGAALATNDVAGVVLQEFFNNIVGKEIDGTQALVDAQGAATPVTVAVWDPEGASVVPAGTTIGIGTGNASADHVLMQGAIANNNLPQTLRLSGVPSGTYNLIVYSVGFSFNSTYEEDFTLVGTTTYPTLTVRGQTSIEFISNPVLVRMSSTNPANRDRGNYVMFENVQPAADGTLLLTATPQTTTVGNAGYFPPINGLQLVKVVPVVSTPPSLSAVQQGANLAISWTGSAAGFILESSEAVGAGASWSLVQGTPNPIAGAGSTTVSSAIGTRFYRLRK